MSNWLSENVTAFRLLLVSLLLLLLSLFFWWLTPVHNFSLVNAFWDAFAGGGGGCPGGPYFDIALYDRNGIRQDFDETTSTYVGDAPLYQPDPDYRELVGRIPCDYPASLPVDVVTGWPRVYPLFIQIRPPTILSGESQPLELIMWLDTKFSGKGINEGFPVVIQPGEKISISFALNAPNFFFSPPNATPGTGFIQVGRTIKHVWSIAPKDSAQGEQFISGEINGMDSAFLGRSPTVNIKLDVQPRDELPLALRKMLIGLGVPPDKLASVGLVLGILGLVLSGTKEGLELYKKWLDVRQARSRREAKLAPKPKAKSRKPRHPR